RCGMLDHFYCLFVPHTVSLETYTLSLHDALPIFDIRPVEPRDRHPMIFSKWEALDPGQGFVLLNDHDPVPLYYQFQAEKPGLVEDRKSTRLNSSHVKISYAVFCLKKKTTYSLRAL